MYANIYKYRYKYWVVRLPLRVIHAYVHYSNIPLKLRVDETP